MKIYILLFLALSGVSFAESPFERELIQLREQKDKAVAASVLPINRNYKAALDSLLKRAIQANDLDAAIAIRETSKDIAALVPEVGKSLSSGRLSIQPFFKRNLYVQHVNFLGFVRPVESELSRADATFESVAGLGNKQLISFRSVSFPDYYLGHGNFRVHIRKSEDADAFRQDVTFKQVPGLADATGVSFESANFQKYFLRIKGEELWIEKEQSTRDYREDATFALSPPLKSK